MRKVLLLIVATLVVVPQITESAVALKHCRQDIEERRNNNNNWQRIQRVEYEAEDCIAGQPGSLSTPTPTFTSTPISTPTSTPTRTPTPTSTPTQEPPMGVIAVPPFFLPEPLISNQAAVPSSFAGRDLELNGHWHALMFLAPKTGNIRKVGMNFTFSSHTMNAEFRLETVSAQLPSGTLWGASTKKDVTSVGFLMNIVQLDADAAVTVNDRLALKFLINEDVPGAGIVEWGLINAMPRHSAYGVTNGSGGTIITTDAAPTGVIEYDDGSYAYIPGVYPANSLTAHSFSSASTPDERGIRFSLPFSAHISGAWLAIDLDNDTDVVLYDADGVTPLSTVSLTNALRLSTDGRTPFCIKMDVDIVANQDYYLVVKPGASSVIVYSMNVQASTNQLQQYMGSFDAQYVTAKNPTGTGSWTATAAQMAFMGIEIDEITSYEPGPLGSFALGM